MRLRKNAKVAYLRAIPLFGHCSKRELEQVAGITTEIAAAEGSTLIEQGAAAREFFVLIDGSVEVRRNGRRIAVLGSGDFFGEMALLTNTPRNATVRATAPSRVLVIVDRDFHRLLTETPSIAVKVLRALAERLPPTAF